MIFHVDIHGKIQSRDFSERLTLPPEPTLEQMETMRKEVNLRARVFNDMVTKKAFSDEQAGIAVENVVTVLSTCPRFRTYMAEETRLAVPFELVSTLYERYDMSEQYSQRIKTIANNVLVGLDRDINMCLPSRNQARLRNYVISFYRFAVVYDRALFVMREPCTQAFFVFIVRTVKKACMFITEKDEMGNDFPITYIYAELCVILLFDSMDNEVFFGDYPYTLSDRLDISRGDTTSCTRFTKALTTFLASNSEYYYEMEMTPERWDMLGSIAGRAIYPCNIRHETLNDLCMCLCAFLYRFGRMCYRKDCTSEYCHDAMHTMVGRIIFRINFMFSGETCVSMMNTGSIMDLGRMLSCMNYHWYDRFCTRMGKTPYSKQAIDSNIKVFVNVAFKYVVGQDSPFKNGQGEHLFMAIGMFIGDYIRWNCRVSKMEQYPYVRDYENEVNTFRYNTPSRGDDVEMGS